MQQRIALARRVAEQNFQHTILLYCRSALTFEPSARNKLRSVAVHRRWILRVYFEFYRVTLLHQELIIRRDIYIDSKWHRCARRIVNHMSTIRIQSNI